MSIETDFSELVVSICKRAGMYVYPSTFWGVCAFIDGFNAARDEGPLNGFREWLVVLRKGGDNFHWIGLVETVLDIPSGAMTREMNGMTKEQHETAIALLGGLFTKFFEHRAQNGVTKIHYDYARWLLRQGWYDGPLRVKKARDTTTTAKSRPPKARRTKDKS